MTKYDAGRRFEWKVKKMFEKRGYFVMRSAGSKGIFDLIAIPLSPLSGSVIAMQLKEYSGSKPKPPKEFVAWRGCACKKWVTKKKGRWESFEVEGVD